MVIVRISFSRLFIAMRSRFGIFPARCKLGEMADEVEDESMVEDTEIDTENLEKESTNVLNDEDAVTIAAGDEKQGGTRLAQLPHTRVRNMMKLDSDLHIASQDSVFLVTKAAELFIQFFAKEAHKKSLQSKRKTIQKRDLDSVIGEIDSMVFLEGALE